MVRIEEFTTIQAPLERCFDLARSVEVHLAGNVHFGEQAVASAGITSGLVGLGERVTWRAKHFGVWQTLTSEMTKLDRLTYFQDRMIKGAFRWMEHDHYFRALSENETEMKDVFRFAAPVPVLGLIAEKLVLRQYMRALLKERNLAVKEIAECEEWRKYVPAKRDQLTESL